MSASPCRTLSSRSAPNRLDGTQSCLRLCSHAGVRNAPLNAPLNAPSRSPRSARHSPAVLSALPLSTKPADLIHHSSRLLSGELKLFLESADISEMEYWARRGIFNGFTCNPVTLSRAGVKSNTRSLTALAAAAFDLGANEIQIQAIGSTPQELVSRSLDIAGIDSARVVVQLLCTDAGIQAANLLRDNNIRINMTGVFTEPQVLAALACSAEYATPLYARLDALSGDATQDVRRMQGVVKAQNSLMRVMVSEATSVSQVADLAGLGCNTFSIPPALAAELMSNIHTEALNAEFDAAVASLF